MRLKRILDMVTGEETFQTQPKKLRSDDDDLQHDDEDLHKKDNDEFQKDDVEMKGEEDLQQCIGTKDVAINTIIENEVSVKVVKQDLIIQNEIEINKKSNAIKSNENQNEEKSEKSREPFFSNKIYEELKTIYDDEFYHGVELEGNSKGKSVAKTLGDHSNDMKAKEIESKEMDGDETESDDDSNPDDEKHLPIINIEIDEKDDDRILLKNCKGVVTNVEPTIAGHKYDIQYYAASAYRAIQVKTLTKSTKGQHTFYISAINDKYDDDTLIVGLNIKHKRFVMFFVSDIKQKEKAITFTFKRKIKAHEDQKWKDDVIYSWSEWEKGSKLAELCMKSVIIDVQRPYLYLDPSTEQEFWMVQRCVKMLISKGILSENITLTKEDDSVTDLYVRNGKQKLKFQLKSYGHTDIDSNPNAPRYEGDISKNSHSMAYAKGDNDFYIVELFRPHLINDFLILSEQTLINEGYIQTETQKGKKRICVFPPEFNEQMKIANKNNKNAKLRGNFTNLAHWHHKDDQFKLPWVN